MLETYNYHRFAVGCNCLIKMNSNTVKRKVSEFQMYNSKQQIHSLLGASGPVIHSPAVPWTRQAASPHPPAVSLTSQ